MHAKSEHVQEHGLSQAVVQLSQEWLKRSSNDTGTTDVVIAMARAHCDLAQKDFESSRSAEGFEHLLEAKAALSKHAPNNKLIGTLSHICHTSVCIFGEGMHCCPVTFALDSFNGALTAVQSAEDIETAEEEMTEDYLKSRLGFATKHFHAPQKRQAALDYLKGSMWSSQGPLALSKDTRYVSNEPTTLQAKEDSAHSPVDQFGNIAGVLSVSRGSAVAKCTLQRLGHGPAATSTGATSWCL